MLIPEEIEQLKIQISQSDDEQIEAELILQLLNKHAVAIATPDKYYVDRLVDLAEKINSDYYKAWAVFHLSQWYRVIADYDTAIQFAQQAIPLFEQIDDKAGLGNAFNNLGVVYNKKGESAESLQHHLKAVQIREQVGDLLHMGNSYNNTAMSYFNLGCFPEAMEYYLKALKIFEQLGNKFGLGNVLNNIATVQQKQKDFPAALQSLLKSRQIHESTGNKNGQADTYYNLASIYQGMARHAEALENAIISLRLREEVGNKWGMAHSYNCIGSAFNDLGKYEEAIQNHFKALQLGQETGDKWGEAAFYHGLAAAYNNLGRVTDAIESQLHSIALAEEIGHKDLVSHASFAAYNFFKAGGDFENALTYHQKYHQVENEISGEQAQRQLTGLNFMHNLDQKEKQLEIEHIRNVDLKRERDRSETLLLNILPGEVAEELKEKGAADAKLFDDVTVLFTDFKSFTKVSERLSPQQLVDELHACFSAFDEIMGKYNIEKIKTIGDAYMAACGLPLPDEIHAEKIIKAALEIKKYMLDRKKERGEMTFEIRIGVHSGPVVAGIVGVKKFAYDIWGDTVNTAMRVEENSEAGKINVSQTTYELVKDKFNCQYHGEIEVKSKGKLKMYFVE